jgi:hypothetical protein
MTFVILSEVRSPKSEGQQVDKSVTSKPQNLKNSLLATSLLTTSLFTIF